MSPIKVGLCGFTMSASEYFERYQLVEVQQTFYDPPHLQTLLRWREQAPPGFEFTMKAWQLITHTSKSRTYRRLRRKIPEEDKASAGAFRDTPVVEGAWQTTLSCARLLRATAILFQCPASFRPTEENVSNLRHFFGSIERSASIRYLWEPRGEWPSAILEEVCRDLDLVHVVDPFKNTTVTPRFAYFRLHGVTGSRHVYSDEELARLLTMIPKDAEQVYVMFNNIPRVRDAERFTRMISPVTL